MALISDIKKCIEGQLRKNKKRFIIFPFGDVGMQFDSILKSAYNITAEYIIDNNLYKYNPNIKPLSFLKEIDIADCVVFLASTNVDIYEELKRKLEEYVSAENIIELDIAHDTSATSILSKMSTKVGKYSYGPICRDHQVIESIGSFCSFAIGVEVVSNHEMKYITTHPMLYAGQCYTDFEIEYEKFEKEKWYFEGVTPRANATKMKRSKIGNDVWLGRNVVITNGANIGNGVIAGAGAVITKDVPDYAIVAGVPARIIGYRYKQEQIEALNKIQWWNWSDDEIRERYDDFYLPVDKFIKKYNL